MARLDTTVRQRILDAALDIIEAEGMKALTQPKIAKATGLRQSHLTYYFPRKADLYIALLDASHERAERRGATSAACEDRLCSLMFDGERIRFFLSILLEIGDDPELQAILRDHAARFEAAAASHFGRGAGDPAVTAFVDELRGIGIRLLMHPEALSLPDVEAVAARHGLRVPSQGNA
ncbi:MAG TPA: helix-turn-helix domain-containing protein [Sinorhizobium sp.]|nr:helix-turn-helix domain-containing protein [Sinorhizobium sp.]